MEDNIEDNTISDHHEEKIIPLNGMYQTWFMDYASYVILERAVPAAIDGLKPVQRRILHSMKDLDDGRYNKVANIIGHTMKYHPHGDASIGDALVQVGQKDILIDMQGNWGNILTGDSAAAPRYIEARLSKFALDVVFNAKTTHWGLSYDGRNREPINLPVKFPLLLAQGAEGIAVGLACKILPHNFNELIDASIAVLRGKNPTIYPDFLTGGMADVSLYNEGLRGGKVRIRAKIRQLDKKTLVIDEIPFGTTTGSLIESVIKANDKGKIKIKKIEDNTAEKAEIVIHLVPGISPDQTIDALYALTDCEVSISPNSCVIENDKPFFASVQEILKISTHSTLNLLQRELEIRRTELQEQWHFSSLEKIFIEKKIYRTIEEAETWEQVIEFIRKGLKPHIKLLMRAVTDEDIARLTEIKIKRISKFDSFKADDLIAKIEEELKKVKEHLDHLVDYAIEYYKNLKKNYGHGRERKTELKIFDTIQATKVVIANKKLYVDYDEGFAGWGIKKDNFVCDCSDIDDIIVFRQDGTMLVTKADSKKFIGKNIIHINVWKRDDKRTIYHLVYQDGTNGASFMKRFAITGITRDKEYDLTKGTKGSNILYFSANPNGEAEVITIKLRPRPSLKKTKFDFNFAHLAVKGRDAQGNVLTKNLISKVELKEQGASTLAARKIWFDDVVHRLSAEERGTYLGEFSGDDKIFTISQKGFYRLTDFNLSNHYDDDLVLIQKFKPSRIVSAIYYDGDKKQFNMKRFTVEISPNPVKFITEHPDSYLEIATLLNNPLVKLEFDKRSNERDDEVVYLAEAIGVKGVSAMGNRLSPFKIKNIELFSPVEKDIDLEDEKLTSKISEVPISEESENSENEGDLSNLELEVEIKPSKIFVDDKKPEDKKKKSKSKSQDEESQPTLF
jgi:topoisomerase IV subunit A